MAVERENHKRIAKNIIAQQRETIGLTTSGIVHRVPHGHNAQHQNKKAF
jgi:hypothetical protein